MRHYQNIKKTINNRKKSFKKVPNHIPKQPFYILFGLLIFMLGVPTLLVSFADTEVEQNNNRAASPTPELQPEVDEQEDPEVSVPVFRTQTSKTEEVPLEKYVRRVVASEMAASFNIEALKAQSLAARTYVINLLLHKNRDDSYTIKDTVDDQVYQDRDELKQRWGADFTRNIDKIKKAVNATKGKVITYKGKPITPAFFSTSNGYTENSEDYWTYKLPYLRSVESPWDDDSPKFIDQEMIRKSVLEQKLNIQIPGGKQVNPQITRTEGHRVDKITLAGQEFSGREIREKLGLHSSDFTVQDKGDYILFRTKGYGHGIGMSQYGANGMAEDGKNYEDIIHYYYQDVDITGMDAAVPTLAKIDED